MSDLIRREELLKQIETDSKGHEGQYGDEWLFIDTINSMPSAEPKEYVKDGTLTVQMPTIKEAKAVDKIVVYADTYKQEYYMPLSKLGKWVEVRFKTIPTNRIAKAKKCSICGKKKDKYVIWNFCPNCGARMEGNK